MGGRYTVPLAALAGSVSLFQGSADACTEAPRNSLTLMAPFFNDATRIDEGVLEVVCRDEDDDGGAACRFRAAYRLSRPDPRSPTKAVVAMYGGETLRVGLP